MRKQLKTSLKISTFLCDPSCLKAQKQYNMVLHYHIAEREIICCIPEYFKFSYDASSEVFGNIKYKKDKTIKWFKHYVTDNSKANIHQMSEK